MTSGNEYELLLQGLESERYENTMEEMKNLIVELEEKSQVNLTNAFGVIFDSIIAIEDIHIESNVVPISAGIIESILKDIHAEKSDACNSIYLNELNLLIQRINSLTGILHNLKHSENKLELYRDLSRIDKVINEFRYSAVEKLIRDIKNSIVSRLTLVLKENFRLVVFELNSLYIKIGRTLIEHLHASNRDYSSIPSSREIMSEYNSLEKGLLEVVFMAKKVDILMIVEFNEMRHAFLEGIQFTEFVGFVFCESFFSNKEISLLKEIEIEQHAHRFSKRELDTLFLLGLEYGCYDLSSVQETYNYEYIIQNSQNIDRLEDVDRFYAGCIDYFGVYQSKSIYDIFFKTVDNLYLKFIDDFDYAVLKDRIDMLRSSKIASGYKFRIEEEYLKNMSKLDVRITHIVHENPELLRDIYINADVLFLVCKVFESKYAGSQDKLSVEAEMAKFYSYVSVHDQSLGDKFKLFAKNLVGCPKLSSM